MMSDGHCASCDGHSCDPRPSLQEKARADALESAIELKELQDRIIAAGKTHRMTILPSTVEDGVIVPLDRYGLFLALEQAARQWATIHARCAEQCDHKMCALLDAITALPDLDQPVDQAKPGQPASS